MNDATGVFDLPSDRDVVPVERYLVAGDAARGHCRGVCARRPRQRVHTRAPRHPRVIQRARGIAGVTGQLGEGATGVVQVVDGVRDTSRRWVAALAQHPEHRAGGVDLQRDRADLVTRLLVVNRWIGVRRGLAAVSGVSQDAELCTTAPSAVGEPSAITRRTQELVRTRVNQRQRARLPGGHVNPTRLAVVDPGPDHLVRHVQPWYRDILLTVESRVEVSALRVRRALIRDAVLVAHSRRHAHLLLRIQRQHQRTGRRTRTRSVRAGQQQPGHQVHSYGQTSREPDHRVIVPGEARGGWKDRSTFGRPTSVDDGRASAAPFRACPYAARQRSW